MNIIIETSFLNENNIEFKITDYTVDLSIFQTKNNYKAILESEMILPESLDDIKVPKVGDIIVVKKIRRNTFKDISCETIFYGPIVSVEKENIHKLKLRGYSLEWYLETAITSEYFEKKSYVLAIEEMLGKFGIKMTTDSDKTDLFTKVTALYLKRNLVEIVNDLLKKSKNGDKYLYLERKNIAALYAPNISAKICITPKWKFLNNRVVSIMNIEEKLGDYTFNYKELGDIVELKNISIVYPEDYKIANKNFKEIFNTKSAKKFGALYNVHIGNEEKAREELNETAKLKGKIEVSFIGMADKVKIFDLIKIKDSFLKINSIYEVIAVIIKSDSKRKCDDNSTIKTILMLEEVKK